jgi:hypothetical protein
MPRVLRTFLAAAIAAAAFAPAARADIYTWLDAKGQLNVSNFPPPDDARLLKVMQTISPDASAAGPAPSAAPPVPRPPDAQALADRVRQLEAEVDMARSQPPVVYAPPAPPVVQYFVQASPPVVQYVVNEAPPSYPAGPWGAGYGCDPSWYSCSFWPGYYPSFVVVGPANGSRPFKPGHGMDFRPRPPHAQPTQTSLVQPLQVPFIQPLVGTNPFPAMPPRPVEGFRRG